MGIKAWLNCHQIRWSQVKPSGSDYRHSVALFVLLLDPLHFPFLSLFSIHPVIPKRIGQHTPKMRCRYYPVGLTKTVWVFSSQPTWTGNSNPSGDPILHSALLLLLEAMKSFHRWRSEVFGREIWYLRLSGVVRFRTKGFLELSLSWETSMMCGNWMVISGWESCITFRSFHHPYQQPHQKGRERAGIREGCCIVEEIVIGHDERHNEVW